MDRNNQKVRNKGLIEQNDWSELGLKLIDGATEQLEKLKEKIDKQQMGDSLTGKSTNLNLKDVDGRHTEKIISDVSEEGQSAPRKINTTITDVMKDYSSIDDELVEQTAETRDVFDNSPLMSPGAETPISQIEKSQNRTNSSWLPQTTLPSFVDGYFIRPEKLKNRELQGISTLQSANHDFHYRLRNQAVKNTTPSGSLVIPRASSRVPTRYFRSRTEATNPFSIEHSRMETEDIITGAIKHSDQEGGTSMSHRRMLPRILKRVPIPARHNVNNTVQTSKASQYEMQGRPSNPITSTMGTVNTSAAKQDQGNAAAVLLSTESVPSNLKIGRRVIRKPRVVRDAKNNIVAVKKCTDQFRLPTGSANSRNRNNNPRCRTRVVLPVSLRHQNKANKAQINAIAESILASQSILTANIWTSELMTGTNTATGVNFKLKETRKRKFEGIVQELHRKNILRSKELLLKIN